MLLRLVPPPPLPTILFSLSFNSLPPELPFPAYWALNLDRCLHNEIDPPPSPHALDKAVWATALIEEVNFDLTENTLACKLIDGSVFQWSLTPGCKAKLQSVLDDVAQSATEADKEQVQDALPSPPAPRTPPSSLFSSPLPSPTFPKVPSAQAAWAQAPTVKAYAHSTRGGHSRTRSLLSALLSAFFPVPFLNLQPRAQLPTKRLAASRHLRRRARSTLVDAFRLFVMPEIKIRMGWNNYLLWASQTMLLRTEQTLAFELRQPRRRHSTVGNEPQLSPGIHGHSRVSSGGSTTGLRGAFDDHPFGSNSPVSPNRVDPKSVEGMTMAVDRLRSIVHRLRVKEIMVNHGESEAMMIVEVKARRRAWSRKRLYGSSTDDVRYIALGVPVFPSPLSQSMTREEMEAEAEFEYPYRYDNLEHHRVDTDDDVDLEAGGAAREGLISMTMQSRRRRHHSVDSDSSSSSSDEEEYSTSPFEGNGEPFVTTPPRPLSIIPKRTAPNIALEASMGIRQRRVGMSSRGRGLIHHALAKNTVTVPHPMSLPIRGSAPFVDESGEEPFNFDEDAMSDPICDEPDEEEEDEQGDSVGILEQFNGRGVRTEELPHPPGLHRRNSRYFLNTAKQHCHQHQQQEEERSRSRSPSPPARPALSLSLSFPVPPEYLPPPVPAAAARHVRSKSALLLDSPTLELPISNSFDIPVPVIPEDIIVVGTVGVPSTSTESIPIVGITPANEEDGDDGETCSSPRTSPPLSPVPSLSASSSTSSVSSTTTEGETTPTQGTIAVMNDGSTASFAIRVSELNAMATTKLGPPRPPRNPARRWSGGSLVAVQMSEE